MNEALKKLHDERQQAARVIQELKAKNANVDEEWSSDDEARWQDANKRYDELSSRIDRAVEADRVDRDMERAEEDAERRAAEFKRRGIERGSKRDEDELELRPRRNDRRIGLAVQGWLGSHLARSGRGKFEVRDEHVRAAAELGISLQAREIELPLFGSDELREFRAQSTAATKGGEFIPEELIPTVERALLAFGGMRDVATVIRTAGGGDLRIPNSDDTANEGSILAENTQVTEQDLATGELVLEAYKYTSELVRVSQELIEDSAINVAQFVGAALGERIARITNRHFTVGTGTAQPRGVMTAAAVGKTAASPTAITFDEIFDLIHSVDEAYRIGAGIMANDSTILAIRKLKSSDNQYLWQPAPAIGLPQSIGGYPVIVNQHVATIAASARTIAFGDFSKYLIRDVASIRLKVLVERYADFDQVGFVMFSRHDGDLHDAGTGPVKVLVQAA